MLDLFGKKKIASLEKRLEEALEDLRRTRESRDQTAKALDRRARELEEAKGEIDQLRRQVKEAEAQLSRAREALSQAEKMVAWLSEKDTKTRAEVEALRRERDDALGRVSRLSEEIARLKAALEEAQKRAARPIPEPESRAEEKPGQAEIQRLRAENEDLRKKIAEQSEKLRLALRKAEHNRRAWLVTQMQLDLAEDRLYFLTHGKPRPVYSAQGKKRQEETLEGVTEEFESPHEKETNEGEGEQES